MKVGLYIRVSSQEQAKEGYSIGEQEVRLRDYCKAMRWSIYKLYADPGYSGGNMDRPALRELIEDVNAGALDKVAVYKLDRLSRSQFDTLYLIEKVFLANNVDFVSMTENFDTGTPMGRAMIGFLAVFAQLERDKIKERTAMGKEARAKEGKWSGGRNIPIGYDYDKANNRFIVNDYEAMQVRELIDLFLEGKGFREIEKIFKEKGYSHKSGTWQPKTMRSVLRSKLYLGYIRFRGEWYKADHVPIIDQETHDKVIALLDQRSEAYKQNGGRAGVVSTYLGGLIYCKKCGAKYGKDSNGRRNKNGEKNYKYVCYSRSKKMRSLVRDPNCKNKNWPINELDEIIFNEIKKLALDPDYIYDIRKEKADKLEEFNKVDIIKREIKKLNEQISRFMDLYGIGKFTIDQVASKVDPLNEQRDALEKELDNLNAATGELTEEETIEIVKSFEDILKRGDFDEIRAVIESLIYYIELDNDDVYIHWKFA